MNVIFFYFEHNFLRKIAVVEASEAASSVKCDPLSKNPSFSQNIYIFSIKIH